MAAQRLTSAQSPARAPLLETEDDEPQRSATVASCILNLANTILGAGTLGIPSAFALCGSGLGSGLLALFAMLSAFGLHLLSSSAQIIEEKKRAAGETPGPATFRSVASAAAPRFSTIIDLAVAVKCFGVATSYLIVIGDVMPVVAKEFLGSKAAVLTRREPWIVLAAALVTPLALKKKLDALRIISACSLACCAGITVLIFTIAVQSPAQWDDDAGVALVSFNMQTLQNLPVFIFAYTCQQNIFAVNNEIRRPTRARVDKVIVTSIVSALCVYLVVGNAGYQTFGVDVKSDVLENYASTPTISVARVGVAILVGSSFPLQCHPSRMCIFSLLDQAKGPRPEGDETDAAPTRNVEHVAVTAIFIVAALMIALSVKSLGLVLSFVGATGSTTISYILPGGIYYTVGPPGVRRYLAFIQFCLGLVIMPSALAVIFMGN